MALLVLFSLFRFEVGCDWSGYYNQYYRGITSEEISAFREPLWWALIYIFNYFELSYPWLNVAAGLMFFWGVNVLARRQPDPFSFLVLLFPVLILNMPMSAVRQAAAIGLVCYAYVLFLDGRRVRFVAVVLVASLLHSSAAAFLLLAPLIGGGYSSRRITISAVVAIPGVYLLITGSAAELAFQRYLDTDTEAAGGLLRVAMLSLTGAFFFLYLRPGWLARFPKDYKLVSLGAMMMVADLALVMISSVIGDRLGYYLVPLQAVILARLPFLPVSKIWTVIAYLGLILFLFTWTWLSDIFQICYVPYKTWLFGFPESSRFIYY